MSKYYRIYLAGGILKILIPIFSTLPSFSTPQNCNLCTMAIDNYSGNGGGAPNLSTPVREAREYGTIGESRIHAKFPNTYPSYGTAAENFTCQKGVFTPAWHWNCTFLQYGGHSNSYYLFLGNGVQFGKVYPSSMKFGDQGYYPHLAPKWFHTRSCNVFWQSGRGGTSTSNAAYWSPAFRGLHSMLGYASLSFDVATHNQPASDFWNRWVTLNQSIWTAYSESEASQGYRNLSGVKGIEVGCLSATGRNYCDLSYEAENSIPASNGASYYVSKVFGTPEYR